MLARMTARKSRPYHHGDLAGALIASATRLLDAKGEAAVTIRAAARGAGVSHAAPKNHFPDRAALMTALAAGFFAGLTAACEAAAAKAAPNAGARLAAFAEAALAWGLKHPHRYRLLWRRDLTDSADKALNAAMDGLYERLLRAIDGATLPAALSRDTYAIALWSMVHGYVSLRLDGNLVAAKDQASGLPRHQAMLTAFLAPQGAPARRPTTRRRPAA